MFKHDHLKEAVLALLQGQDVFVTVNSCRLHVESR